MSLLSYILNKNQHITLPNSSLKPSIQLVQANGSDTQLQLNFEIDQPQLTANQVICMLVSNTLFWCIDKLTLHWQTNMSYVY